MTSRHLTCAYLTAFLLALVTYGLFGTLRIRADWVGDYIFVTQPPREVAAEEAMKKALAVEKRVLAIEKRLTKLDGVK